jgi:hypothetical protein
LLAARLKEEAVRRHAKPGALVAQALEQFLGIAVSPPEALSIASQGWAGPLAALEARVATLEARKPPVKPAAAKLNPPSEPVAVPHLRDGAITTGELAERLGMKRPSLNERIRRQGGASVGMEISGYRCTGQARGENGGPPRWLWEAV